MTALDRMIPTPRRLEFQEIDLAIPPERAFEVVRHGDLATSPLVRALFAIRTLPGRLLGEGSEPLRLTIDELISTSERPGFQVLASDAPREVVVGAIGKVWHLDIPFVHVADAAAYAAFAEPDFVKVAWAIRVDPRGERDSHVTFELRVDATDDEAYRKFENYFRLIGPGSHFIRWSLMRELGRVHGTPESVEATRELEGDDLLAAVVGQATHGITIEAAPEAIWPWLVQMGCGRGGFYSYDLLDNGGVRSAREIHPELQRIAVGDVIPAAPGSAEGFEVLRIEPGRALVLGGLFDAQAERQLPFASDRPADYWQATWSFVLERLDATRTRLHVRARVSCPESGRLHLAWIRFVHPFMEHAQLRRLAARASGQLAPDDARDVAEGVAGAALMAFGLLTPFLRGRRQHWGVSPELAATVHPGDELVPAPLWEWTHGIDVAAPARVVWPWVAQIGANKAGFYSYQWLENVVGCGVRNAETIHPEWHVRLGDSLSLHPKMPGLDVVRVDDGRCFVAHAKPDPDAKASGGPWIASSWAFIVEPTGESSCRVVSRFRADCSDDFQTRLSFGPSLLEPIGFAMDRRMLLGIRDRSVSSAAGAAE